MFDTLIRSLPADWQEAATALLSLIAWIPEWQQRLLRTAFAPDAPWWAVAGSWALLALPALLVVIAIWTTMLSVYTLPFRSARGAYIRTLAFTWWDAGRSIAVYWAGVAKFVLLAGGLAWAGVRYALAVSLRVVRSLFAAPAAAMDWTAQRYFKPGVPWLAFVLILGWSALEAAIFTFTLRPTMYEVLYDITGAPPNLIALSAILYMFLFLLIAGSFAVIYAVTEALEQRRYKDLFGMVVVELFVMFFEVVFLYRELVDAITPWIAQQSGVRLGLFSTLALASFGWVGIRAMTWFLFGRYGTPALMAILSRQTLGVQAGAAERPDTDAFGWWNDMLKDLKQEQAWLRGQAERLNEAMLLPILQLLANGLNFILVLVGGRPAFDLPFSSLEEAMARLPGPGMARRSEAEPRGRPAPALLHENAKEA